MKAPNLCHKCQKIIMLNEVQKDGKFYHKKCINQRSDPNSNDFF